MKKIFNWFRSVRGKEGEAEDVVQIKTGDISEPSKDLSFFGKFRKCFANVDEKEVLDVAGNSSSAAFRDLKFRTCPRNDEDPTTSRVRDWVMESARHLVPPTTPCVEGSQRDEAFCESERSKAATSTQPLEDGDPATNRPVLAKYVLPITHTCRSSKIRGSSEEVQFSRRSQPSSVPSPSARSMWTGATTPTARRESAPDPKPSIAAPPAGPEPTASGADAPGDSAAFRGFSWASPLGSLSVPIVCTRSRHAP